MSQAEQEGRLPVTKVSTDPYGKKQVTGTTSLKDTESLFCSSEEHFFSLLPCTECLWLHYCQCQVLILLRHYPIQFGESLAALVDRCPNHEPGVDFRSMKFEDMIDGLETKFYCKLIM
jgi:hypothetical protein